MSYDRCYMGTNLQRRVPSSREPGYFERWVLQQMLLLKTVISDEALARSAWQEWRERFTLDEIDSYPVVRFLPMVSQRLLEIEKEDDLLPILRGMYRKTWFVNVTFENHALRIASDLTDLGIDYVLAKGAALTFAYYKDPGLRPCRDIDILVRKEDVYRANEYFLKQGWPPRLFGIDECIGVKHGTSYELSEEFSIDLHWSLLSEWKGDLAVKSLWENTKNCQVRDSEVRILGPSELLLHACIHGVRGPLPDYFWALDALKIIETSASEIDWQKTVRLARDYSVVNRFHRALQFLQDTCNAPIDAQVYRYMDSRRLKFADKVDSYYFRHGFSRTWGGVLYALADYQRLGDEAKKRGFVLDTFGRLKQRLGLPALLSLIPVIFYRSSVVCFQYLRAAFTGK